MWYLIGISFALCVAYFGVLILYCYFFKNELPPVPQRSYISVIIIFVLSICGYIIAFSVPDPELSNRIQHGFGGGFLAFLVCFLAVKDSKLPITRFQFFTFSFFLVTTLGVGNEITEYLFQNYAHISGFATNINDTWHDLISNTVGTLIAAIIFVPFIKK